MLLPLTPHHPYMPTPRGANWMEEMYGIHFLTSRTSDHPVETMKSGPRFTDAVVDAKSQFADVKIRNQSVIGYMIRDNGGNEVTRWYSEAVSSIVADPPAIRRISRP